MGIEMTDRDKIVEIMARIICEFDGCDPDNAT